MDFSNIENILGSKIFNYIYIYYNDFYDFLGYLVYYANEYPALCKEIDIYCKKFPDKVNNVNKYGWTSLTIAARENNIEAATILIYNGANVNYMSELGTSTLSFALNKKRMAKLLLEHDAKWPEGAFGIAISIATDIDLLMIRH